MTFPCKVSFKDFQKGFLNSETAGDSTFSPLFFLADSVDRLDERCKAFFSVCKKNPDQQVEFEKIKEEYKKVTEDASDKIQVAEDCYGLVDRYLRKLDEELLKFKLELEADNR